MLLFIIIIVSCAIISIISGIICDRYWINEIINKILFIIFAGSALVGIITLFLTIGFLINLAHDCTSDQQEKYDCLNYRIEHNLISTDDIEEIEKFNYQIEASKENHENIWYGIVYGTYWKFDKTIDLNKAVKSYSDRLNN
jgi:hypothetical protein